LPAGPYVRIAVTDDGPGIDRDVLRRMFDPFFTSKATGTGLGLSIAEAIVTKHHGALTGESPIQDDRGTRFVIHLPAAVGAAAPELPSVPVVHRPRSGRRVLVMDDEPLTLDVTVSLLRAAGHDVQACSSGADAIRLARLARSEGRPYHVAVLDLTIRGGEGGAAIAATLSESSPETALLAYSGYSSDDVMSRPRAHGFDAALAKPFRAAQLAEAIAQAIDAHHRARLSHGDEP
jgi:CheY-like chemotaxis protein